VDGDSLEPVLLLPKARRAQRLLRLANHQMINFTKELPVDTEKMSHWEVKELRDFVFERTISDLSWMQVSHRWMNPVEREWLLRYAREMQRTRNTKK
jgi:hypothetical protein